MSNLLARAVDEVREGNQDIRESVRHIGNKFLNHVEVSAQEAVYLTMQMKLRRASRDVIFVNTSPPNDRVILLKPLDEIQNMPANATDIESDNILKKYERRPKALEKLCLADFAAWYTFEREKPDEVEKKDNDDVYNDDNNNSGTTYRVEHQERQDSAEGCRQSDTMNIFAPQNDSHSQYDIGQDIGMAVNNPNIEELQHPRMPDSQLYPILQILNKKQKEIFYHIIHWIKTKTDPLHVFVTGGAGVGKSVVLKSLYQVLLKHLSSRPGENPDTVLLLLMAPTGKAAYNIKGSTIHSALQIPASQGFHYKPLTSERLNTLQAKYRNLKIIFIDEISMVGNGMFNYINLRLQQIMANNQLFGGVSIVAFGDLYQLKPVFDGWIFNDLRHDYGPLALNIWKDLFKMFELTDIMRQKDDLDFAQLLNRVREGNTLHMTSVF
ncbi:uncharacterized protein [Ptychodera flava]|uniref:uncharacterized protein n=1 Tax=Ptychodera flava TaxID=63121 RepID=UPI00396A9676